MAVTERDRLLALAKYEAVFTEPGFTMGRWVAPEPGADGVRQMPWFEYGPAADAFHEDAGAHGWIVPFDWMSWIASPEGQRYVADPGLVAQAPVADLEKLLTAIIRGDRFSEGELAGAYESGVLTAIVRRAAALVAADHGEDR